MENHHDDNEEDAGWTTSKVGQGYQQRSVSTFNNVSTFSNEVGLKNRLTNIPDSNKCKCGQCTDQG